MYRLIMMREHAIVASLAVAFGVKDAWSIVMELTCFALVALALEVVLAE